MQHCRSLSFTIFIFDSERMQPVLAILCRSVLPSLLTYLDEDGRKIDTWYTKHKLACADFSDWPDTFININTPEEKVAVEQKIAGDLDATPTFVYKIKCSGLINPLTLKKISGPNCPTAYVLSR